MDRTACHFVFYNGPRKGEAQAFDTARISIGRAGNCDFRLEAFQLEQVAPHHAEVLLEEGNIYCLYDLGAKAGTWINGERVHERCMLMHEDYIRFGQEGPEVIFRIGIPVHGTQPLPQMFPVTAELEFFSGSDAGRIFPINAATVSNIGRRADLEVPLDPRGDMIVSGNHSNIRYVNGHFVLTDSSRNGTYVNNELLDQPTEIIQGDVIMLGDGGPMARFHVDNAKRHYPNHRPLSPVIKRQSPSPTPSVSALKSEDPQKPATLTNTTELQSSKPFTTGSPLPATFGEPAGAGTYESMPLPPDLDTDKLDSESPDGELAAMASEDSDLGSDQSYSDTPAMGSDTVNLVSQESSTGETPNQSVTKSIPVLLPANAAVSSAIPLMHRLQFKPGRKIIFAAVGIVVLIAVIALLSRRHKTPADSAAARSNYQDALEELTPIVNMPGTFTVMAPMGWVTLNHDNYVSMESRDKEVSVDYVRDPGLNEAKVREMLGRNGATVAPTAEEKKVESATVKTLTSSLDNIRRIAVLQQPKSGAPAVALLETSQESLAKLDQSALDKILIENFTVPPIPNAAVAKAPANTSAAGNLPKPPAATPTQAVPPKAPAVAVEQPASTPVSAPADVASSSTLTTSTQIVSSKSLKLNLDVPDKWKASSDEAEGMILLSDSKGLEIRVARDPGMLKSDVTFKAMTDEGWKNAGVQPGPNFQAGEFSRKDQNLLLVLIPEKKKTTLVIYATSAEEFSAIQRSAISKIIGQLLPAK